MVDSTLDLSGVLDWYRRNDPLQVPPIGDEPVQVNFSLSDRLYWVEFGSGAIYTYNERSGEWRKQQEELPEYMSALDILSRIKETLQKAEVIEAECEIPRSAETQGNMALAIKRMCESQAAAIARKLVPWLGSGKAQRTVFKSDLTRGQMSVARVVVMTPVEFKLLQDLVYKLPLSDPPIVEALAEDVEIPYPEPGSIIFHPRSNAG